MSRPQISLPPLSAPTFQQRYSLLTRGRRPFGSKNHTEAPLVKVPEALSQLIKLPPKAWMPPRATGLALAVAVAAVESTAVVLLLTEARVVPKGMPKAVGAARVLPTSPATKLAVLLVKLVL